MTYLAKSAVLSIGLLIGASAVAHAQSSSVAALPPNAAPAATAPTYGAYPGPNPGASWGGVGQQTQAVTPSAPYVGPSPGAGNGAMPPHFEKSADWDQNTTLHPYTSSMGPRPN